MGVLHVYRQLHYFFADGGLTHALDAALADAEFITSAVIDNEIDIEITNVLEDNFVVLD